MGKRLDIVVDTVLLRVQGIVDGGAAVAAMADTAGIANGTMIDDVESRWRKR